MGRQRPVNQSGEPRAEPARPQPKEPTAKPVRLYLSPKAHRLLRMVAANAGQPMAVFARNTLERAIRDDADLLGINVKP